MNAIGATNLRSSFAERNSQWGITRLFHELAIQPANQVWVRASNLDRALRTTFRSALFALLSGVGTFTLALLIPDDQRDIPAFAAGLAGAAAGLIYPWVKFYFLGNYCESLVVGRDFDRFLQSGNVLVTRAEYLGGHPELPHGRFVYLVLGGTISRPHLAVVLPGAPGKIDEEFLVPLLDFESTREQRVRDDSLAQTLIPLLVQRPRTFRRDKVELNVRYLDTSGHRQTVEFANFWSGNDEVRQWRNFLVCAQSEAVDGPKPRSPWRRLPADPAQETPNDGGGNGRRGRGSAFARR